MTVHVYHVSGRYLGRLVAQHRNSIRFVGPHHPTPALAANGEFRLVDCDLQAGVAA